MAHSRWEVAAQVTRTTRRHRRLLGAMAAAACIATLGLALQPPQVSTRPVVVAATDLPVGRALDPGDLTVAEVPAGVLPATTFATAHDLVGQVLSAPLAAGEAVGGHRLTATPAWSLPPGTRALPVRFADARAAALLSAGQYVDVVAGGPPGLEDATAARADLVAQQALVLSVVRADSGADAFAPPPADDGTLVVLAVPPETALAVAGAQARNGLGFVMHPSP